jgi:hypothetical protein
MLPSSCLQVPGKTLVGLLLAEYRRRTCGERVAYLCPTIQLARQAAGRAAGYGIAAVTLVGRQRSWGADFTSYQRAQTVAITTYSAVFNSNPRIDSAQTLVLDDAHAGEGLVAHLWSVEAARGAGGLYDALLAGVIDGLPPAFAESMRDTTLDPYRRYDVELVPPMQIARQADLLREALAIHAADRDDHNHHAGSMIAERIGHCLVYVS